MVRQTTHLAALLEHWPEILADLTPDESATRNEAPLPKEWGLAGGAGDQITW